MDNPKQTTKELIAEAEKIRNSLKYVYREEKSQYDRLINIQQELFERTKQVIYLVDICRLEKAMHGGHTKIAKNAAIEAFKVKKTELTLFFLVSHLIVNQPPKKAIEVLNGIFKPPVSPALIPIRDLYYSSLQAAEGYYLNANRLLHKAKSAYQPGIYWQLNLVVDDFYFGANEKKFLSKTFSVSKFKQNKNCPFIFSISCDRNYFELYGETFLRSFFINNPTALVHIFFVHQEQDAAPGNMLDMWGHEERVVVTHFTCPSNVDYRPVSAVMRLLAIRSLLESAQLPVLFGEIDSVVVKPLHEIINRTIEIKADHLVRTIGSYLPWQRNTCGFGIFMPTMAGIRAARLLEQYILGLFNNNEKLFWADQCALEACIRYSSLIDPTYSVYRPPTTDISAYFVTPTGGGGNSARKLNLINQEMKRRGYL